MTLAPCQHGSAGRTWAYTQSLVPPVSVRGLEKALWVAAHGCVCVYTPAAEYSIGSPRFEQVTIALPASSMAVVKPTLDTSASSNNDASTVLLTIIAHNASPTNMFVQNATVNGKALPTPFVEHGDLVAGGDNGATLEFWMGHLPAAWGAGAGEAGEAAEEV